jgi:GTP-binding protein
MVIKSAEFIKSAAGTEGFYRCEKKQFAVAGRSNVGKSSFINMLAGRKKLAKTSRTPGRTRLINYFDFGEFILTDLPGYGFAAVAKAEKAKWGGLIESYLEGEPTLARVILLVDIRHTPTEQDAQLTRYLYAKRIPFQVAATKADKLPRSKLKAAVSDIAAKLGIGAGNVLLTSSQTGQGKDDALHMIEEALRADANG